MINAKVKPLNMRAQGVIAVVLAGILIGNRGRAFAMSDVVADYLEKFWELLDEILNALLFMLIGVEVLVIAFTGTSLLAGLIVIAIVLGVPAALWTLKVSE